MKRKIKLFAAICLLAAGCSIGGASVHAETSSAPKGNGTESSITLDEATPEEIEDIGYAAMVEAGLVTDSDIEIEKAEVPWDNDTANAALIISIIALVMAVAAAGCSGFLWYATKMKGGDNKTKSNSSKIKK